MENRNPFIVPGRAEAMRRRRFVPYTERQGQAPVPVPECEPTYTLDRQIAAARAEMGEQRWAELNAEWEIEPPQVLKERRQ